MYKRIKAQLLCLC